MAVTAPIAMDLASPPIQDMDRLAIEHLTVRSVLSAARKPNFSGTGPFGHIAGSTVDLNRPFGEHFSKGGSVF